MLVPENLVPLSSSTVERAFALIIALLLGHFFVVVQAQVVWTNYWLTKDPQQGEAIVTKVLWTGHNAVAYHYWVNQKEYAGEDGRNWQDPRYAKVGVGEKSVVYFSVSHPWLSRLTLPRSAMVEGLPVILLAWCFIVLFLITAINPYSKWALKTGVRQAHPQGNG